MFEIGDRVMRIEDRGNRGATVLERVPTPEGASYRIAYDEGGEGWWPESALEAE